MSWTHPVMNSTHASNLFSAQEKWTNIQNKQKMAIIFHDHPDKEQWPLQFSKPPPPPPVHPSLSSFFLQHFFVHFEGFRKRIYNNQQPATTVPTRWLPPPPRVHPSAQRWDNASLAQSWKNGWVFSCFCPTYRLYTYIIDGWLAMAWCFFS